MFLCASAYVFLCLCPSIIRCYLRTGGTVAYAVESSFRCETIIPDIRYEWTHSCYERWQKRLSGN
ncbi:hypothetical protein KP509_01G085700 [Ceratopteris richardii]|uniref:Secreted protein n=1 Tax=Ceratopteris richardii TaxID=49495 RepID=A0A8T2VEV9_CERRI|nr:hypothetical protein KP509_01G085700 [Ceratopteris richardii]